MFLCIIDLIHILCVSTGDVVQRANDVPYGLCASVWSENAGRIHRVASKLQVNSTFKGEACQKRAGFGYYHGYN